MDLIFYIEVIIEEICLFLGINIVYFIYDFFFIYSVWYLVNDYNIYIKLGKRKGLLLRDKRGNIIRFRDG